MWRVWPSLESRLSTQGNLCCRLVWCPGGDVQPVIVVQLEGKWARGAKDDRKSFSEKSDHNSRKDCLECQTWRASLYVCMLMHFTSVQSLSHVQLFVTPWIAARQASLSITNSRSSLKLTSIESVMPSSHLILCRPLLLLPPVPPSIRVFSNESTLRMRWPKYWSFTFSIVPSKEHPGLISFRMDWLDLCYVTWNRFLPFLGLSLLIC